MRILALLALAIAVPLASPGQALADPPSCSDSSFSTLRDSAVDDVFPSCTGQIDSLIVDSQPSHGALVAINPDDPASDWTYIPGAGFLGDDSFTYRARNADGDSAPATVTIHVLAARCDDVYPGSGPDQPVQVSLSCQSPNSLTYELTSQPTHGSVSDFDASAGTFTYSPDTGFQGLDSITYRATTADGASNEATVWIVVGLACLDSQNWPALAGQPTPSATAGSPINISLICASGDGSPFNYELVTQPQHGTISGFDPASGSLTYTADPLFTGTDTFTYRAVSVGTASSAATVSIQVSPSAPQPPSCSDVDATTPAGQATQVSLTCTGAGPLTYRIDNPPASGSISDFDTQSGALTYTPNPDFTGTDSFTYNASNDIGQSADATATLYVCGKPTVDAFGPARDPNAPGVELGVSGSAGSPSCRGEDPTGIKKLEVYIDDQLLYSDEIPCVEPHDTCEQSMYRAIQLPYAKLIGTHSLRVEAEDQLGHRAAPVVWSETVQRDAKVANVPAYTSDAGKECKQLKVRHYQIRGHALYGTPCADRIPVHKGVTIYYGFGGDDTIRSGGGSDRIKGGPGDDTILTGRGSDKVRGGAGDDRIDAGPGDDTVAGDGGNNTLIGGPGADQISGGAGNDFVRGGATKDTIVGGGGTNTLSYADGTAPGFEANPDVASTKNGVVQSTNPETRPVSGFPAKHGERGVYVNLSGNPGNYANDSAAARFGGGSDKIQDPQNFQNVIGTAFADFIIGSDADNTIDAGPGPDVVRGGGGNDHIYGGEGGDYLDGEGGQVSGPIRGGTGTDTCLSGGDFSPGPQTCEGSNPNAGVQPGPTDKITIGSFEPDDSGFSRADLFVRGSAGADSINAIYSAGKVHLTATGQNEGRFDTADGVATGCNFNSNASANCPIDGADSIIIYGAGGNDVLSAPQFPTGMSVGLLGGDGRDTLTGGDRSEDVLVDGPGDFPDTLRGNASDDTLFENDGADTLNGGDGNDLFVSSTVCDADTIKGGEGDDNANWAQLKGPEISPDDPNYPSANDQLYQDPLHGIKATLANGDNAGTLDRQGTACANAGQIYGMENLEGSRGPDVLIGNNSNNHLLGRSGPDVLRSKGGNDTILANNRDSSQAAQGTARADDIDTDLNCGDGSDLLKRDPKDVNFENCERHPKAPGAEARVSGIHSGPTGGDDTQDLDEATIGAPGDGDSPSPAAFFRLDEGSGTNAANWAGDDESSTDGSYENGVTLRAPGALPESHAVQLDGVNDYLDLTSNWDPSASPPPDVSYCAFDGVGWSIEMWVKFAPGMSSTQYLFSRTNGQSGVFLYRSADGRLGFKTVDAEGFSPTVTSDDPVSDGDWHHVVATIEDPLYPCPSLATRGAALTNQAQGSDWITPPRITLYVDGFTYALGYDRSVVPGSMPDADNLVGALSGPSGLSGWLHGEIDDVAIYDQAITEGDVQQHLAVSDASPSPTILLPPVDPSDSDADGVPDSLDNCPNTANPDQTDSDLDGTGDACQIAPDTDADGVPDSVDNCPELSNPDQADADGNGIGDVCDPGN